MKNDQAKGKRERTSLRPNLLLLDFQDMACTLLCKHCSSGYVLSFSFDYIFPYLCIFQYPLVYLCVCIRSIPRMNRPSGLEVMHDAVEGT